MSVVLDASALIALIKREPGADLVGASLDGGLVSSVIFAESLSKLANLGYDAEAARLRFVAAGVTVMDFTAADVGAVLSLHRLVTRGVSLADRVCLALAIQRGLPVLTGDRAWADLGLPVEVRLIR